MIIKFKFLKYENIIIKKQVRLLWKWYFCMKIFLITNGEYDNYLSGVFSLKFL